MDCEIRDELALQFMLAADEDADAHREWRRAMTATQREGAATRMRRVREHALYTLTGVHNHTREHGCALPELPDLAPLPETRAITKPEPPISVVESAPVVVAVEPVPSRKFLYLPAYAWGLIAGCVLGLAIALASS